MNNKLLEEKTHDTDNSEVYEYDSVYRVTDFERGTLSSDKTSVSTKTDTPNQLQSQNWDLDGANNWNSTELIGLLLFAFCLSPGRMNDQIAVCICRYERYEVMYE